MVFFFPLTQASPAILPATEAQVGKEKLTAYALSTLSISNHGVKGGNYLHGDHQEDASCPVVARQTAQLCQYFGNWDRALCKDSSDPKDPSNRQEMGVDFKWNIVTTSRGSLPCNTHKSAADDLIQSLVCPTHYFVVAKIHIFRHENHLRGTLFKNSEVVRGSSTAGSTTRVVWRS